MKKNKKVSVIIPVYNQQDLIYRCLDSIPKRDDLEIIVVNDGSWDKTKERLLKYKEFMYPELNIISYDKNKGVSYARNQGLDIATGKYIIMIDSDDYVYTDKFNLIMDKYLGKADIIYYDMEDNFNNIFPCRPNTYEQRYGMFKFYKKSIIGDMRFVIGMQYAEDKDFTLRLLEKKPSVYFTEIVMYHYNYPRTGSLSYIGRQNDLNRREYDSRR